MVFREGQHMLELMDQGHNRIEPVQYRAIGFRVDPARTKHSPFHLFHSRHSGRYARLRTLQWNYRQIATER